MKYAIAIVLPPLGLLACGKIFQAILCLILMLTLIGWPFASLWAVLVVHDYHADCRARELERAVLRSGGRPG